MRLIKKAMWIYICLSAMYIVLGICLIIFPKISAVTICYILGFLALVYGCVKLSCYFSLSKQHIIHQFDFSIGLLNIIIGIIFLIHPKNILTLLPVIIGFIIIIDGILKIQTTFESKKAGYKNWFISFTFSLICCILGFTLIIKPFAGISALMILTGISFIANGLQNLYFTIFMSKVVKSSSPLEVSCVELN